MTVSRRGSEGAGRASWWVAPAGAAVLAGGLWLAGCGAPPAARAGRVVAVVGLDTMRFAPETLAVASGERVTIVFRNAGLVPHDLVSQGATEDIRLVDVPRGREARGVFRGTSPGTYLFVCTQPAHTGAGMVGRITVD